MVDTIRELKVDEVENVVAGGGNSGSGSGTDSDSRNLSQMSRTLKSIVWGSGRC